MKDFIQGVQEHWRWPDQRSFYLKKYAACIFCSTAFGGGLWLGFAMSVPAGFCLAAICSVALVFLLPMTEFG